jgi:hypothetical protein
MPEFYKNVFTSWKKTDGGQLEEFEDLLLR